MTLLKQGEFFSFFYLSTLLAESAGLFRDWLQYPNLVTNSNVMELFIVPLCKKERAFLPLFLALLRRI